MKSEIAALNAQKTLVKCERPRLGAVFYIGIWCRRGLGWIDSLFSSYSGNLKTLSFHRSFRFRTESTDLIIGAQLVTNWTLNKLLAE
jgi:hypothetical protein